MTDTPATLTATGITGFAGRAIAAAQTHRAADPDGFDRRCDSPDRWAQWVRRCRAARTIAAALQVPVSWVTVTDDPHREYRPLGVRMPGDLITVTDPETGRTWQLIPDHTTKDDGWLLIDNCPACDAEIPAIRIASLADLGEYLDPDGEIWPAEDAHFDPAHKPGCTFNFGTPG